MSKNNPSQSAKSTPRLDWGRHYENLPKMDFVGMAVDSYNEFLGNGITEIIKEIMPVEDFTGKNWSLVFGDHSVGASKFTPLECINKGITFTAPLKIEATLINKQTGEKSTQEVFLGDMPMMTDKGTFVINGIERCVVNQLVRAPGVYFMGDLDPVSGRMLYFAEIRPNMHGSWLEFQISRSNVMSVRIDRRRKFAITTFLRALGFGSNEEMMKLFAPVLEKHPEASTIIEATLKKDPTHGSAEGLLEIYKKMRPGEPAVLETAQDFIYNLFFNPRRYNLSKVGRYKLNKRLGLEIENKEENWVLTKDDIVATILSLLSLQFGEGDVDDIDHLGNRRVRLVGELVGQAAFRVGVLRLERAIKERMSMLDVKAGKALPNQVVNARPVVSAVNEFFRTSQLSAILDQTNPLSEVDSLRKLSVMGVGGISRERASFSIRDINASQYSRICPVRSPEGPNIGLVTYMALYARVDEYGFLQAPYALLKKEGDKIRKTEEFVYLSADDEWNRKISHAMIGVDKNGFITDERVAIRYRGEFLEAPVSEVELMDVVPSQVVGTAAALIPFLAHDDGIRALMAANMQAQAVPLVHPEAPVVGTGMEEVVANAMGWVVRAPADGVVDFADASKVIFVDNSGKKQTFYATKFKRTSPNGTCYNQKVVTTSGTKVKKGDVLIDGPSSQGGELALGVNLNIAYMHYDGYGYEDAIVMSDRVVKDDALTSVHIEEYICEVVDTKLGPEELTADIPNVGESELAHLDEMGIVVPGTYVGPNSVLVGKIQPKGETELSAEERLLRAIFGEKAREVRDTSLRMPHGESGTVVDIQVLDKEKGDELSPGVNRMVKVRVAQLRKIQVGDKVKGRHGNKGIVARIVPVADMPYLPDGTPIDIIISPLSVLARMNLGQLLEAHLGWALSKTDEKVAVPVFENISEDLIVEAFKKAGLPTDGKTTLFDGRTGLPFADKVVVGKTYILKLHHMVEDKIHARSTGPYSLVTQQPLGGKARMGGQRLGEMEVWALEAHKAAYMLQEMLTVKSDDIVGRSKAFEAIVKGLDIVQTSVPESFKVLVKELQSLGLNITPVGVVSANQTQAAQNATQIKEEEKAEKEAAELESELGAVAVETDELKSEDSAQELEVVKE